MNDAEIRFYSFHFFLTWWKSKGMLATYLPSKCNSNLAIKIFGFLIAPKRYSTHPYKMYNHTQNDQIVNIEKISFNIH